MFAHFNIMRAYEPCNTSCMNYEHGNAITSVMSMGREVTDKELCGYISSICYFCGTSVDSRRYSSPSVAACHGRTDVCKWLICQKYGKLNEGDSDGCTPLHRALYFGQIETAVALLKLGAKLDILDRSAMTQLDQILFDNIYEQVKVYSNSDKYIATVWGKNSNYTLGTSSKEINTAEKFEMFYKKYPKMYVKQVAIEKYHAFVVCTDGSVYGYGKADGGRLGIDAEGIIMEPTPIKFQLRYTPLIDKVIVERNHTIFLSSYMTAIYVCGSNEHYVLGLGEDVKVQKVPVNITVGNGEFSGIVTTRFHTITWNCRVINSWGLNGGQLGHALEEGKYIKTSKVVSNFKLPSKRLISNVATSPGATVVFVDNGDIYLLQHYICRKLGLGIYNIAQISMFGGKPDNFDGPTEAKTEQSRLVLVTRDGACLSWQENDPVLSKCEFQMKRKLNVVKAILHKDGFMMLTTDREVYQATFGEKKQTSHTRKLSSADKAINDKLSDFFQITIDVNGLDRVFVELERIPRLYNPVDISCDGGDNFAAIQMLTIFCRKIAPVISPSNIINEMKIAREIRDCDYTIKVGYRTFMVDKYIMVNGCKKFKYLISKSKTNSIEFDNIDPDVFEVIIEFLYTNRCGFTTRNYEVPTKFLEMSQKAGFDDPTRFISHEAKKINMNRLYKDLKAFKLNKNNNCINSYVTKFRYKKIVHEREGSKDSYDVDIKCNDDKTLQAHRTVLEIRSEYFRSLLSSRWKDHENTIEISLNNPSYIVQPLLDYIYTDNIFLEKTDMEKLYQLLILANELLFPRLIEMCEVELNKKIDNKNVFRMLSIAHLHNATQLKECCMEVICLNLAYYLDNNYLNEMDKDILLDLTKFYIRWNKKVSQRTLLPINDPVPASEIRRISKMNSVNMNFSDEIIYKNTKTTHSRPHRRPRKLNDHGMMEDDDDDMISRLMGRHPLEEMHRMHMSNDYQMPSRLLGITTAMEQMKKMESITTDYTALYKKDYPDMGQMISSPSSAKIKIKMPKINKMSQREKKRLSSESETPKGSLSESPKSPWTIPSTSVGSLPVEDISTIMNNEKKQKENVIKMINKPLINTQIEDKAVGDLKEFYNVDNVSDEVISVERVEIGTIPSPSWVKK